MNRRNIRPGMTRSTVCAAVGLACSMVVLTAVPLDAQAQGWSFEPVVRLGYETDDNARLDFRTDEEISLDGALFDIRAGILYESPLTNFEFTPQVLIRSYPDEPDFDSDDLFLQSRFYRSTRNSEFGFRMFFDEQQIRNAERADSDLDVEDPDDVVDDATGDVFVRGKRSKWRVIPEWNYDLSNKSSIGVELEYFDVAYDEELADFLTDYTDARLRANYLHAFSETTTGIISASTRDFQSDDDLDNDIKGHNLMVGFERDLSSTTRVRALVGYEVTDVDQSDSEGEVVADFYLQRRYETIKLLAQVRRQVNATGSGELTVRNSINLGATRDLSEKISAGIGVYAYDAETLGEEVLTVEASQYVRLRARFIWYLTPAFSAEVDYRYTLLDRGLIAGEGANSNQVNLWLAYHPNSDGR